MGAAMGLSKAKVELAGDSAADLARHGQQLMERGKLDEALADYDRAVSLEPDNFPILVGRSYVLQKLDRWEDALKDATRVIELAPKQWKVYANRGGLHGHMGNHELALQDFDQAILLRPTEWALYEGRAYARKAMGDPARAATDIREALRLSGGLEGARRPRLLIVFAQFVPPAEALPALKRATQLDPRDAAAWRLLSAALRKLKRFDESLKAVAEALLLRPGDLEARAEQAMCLVVAKRRAQAQRALSDLLQGQPRLPLAYRARAMLRSEQQDLKGALADLDVALRFAPGDLDARWLRGQLRFQAGDLAGAERDIQGVAAASSAEGRVKELLAKVRAAIARGGGQPSAGVKPVKGPPGTQGAPTEVAALEKALLQRPDDPLLLTKLGIARAEAGQAQTALTALDKALSLDPSIAAAWSKRAQIKAKLGRLSEALKDMDQAVRRAPKLAKVWALRGALRGEAQDVAGARKDYDRALDIDPMLFGAWLNRADNRAQAGDLPGAIRDLSEAARLRPKMGLPLARRAEYRRIARDRKGAIQDLSAALEKRQRAKWFDMRGNLRREAGDPEGAVQDTVRATELRPDVAGFWANRGSAESQLDRHALAEKSFTRAIKLDPKLALAYYGRAYARYLAGNHEGAVADFDACLKRTSMLEAYGLRGLALAKLGRKSDAKAALQAFLERAPSGHPMRVEAKQALDSLP
jgi:tetratricopeptide (TPR) repeat protein